MEAIFALLEYKNILSQEGISMSTIASYTVNEIFDLAEAIVTLSQGSELNPSTSIFAHSASLSLGGSREDCSSLPCRNSRIDELARFALMYSDKVYINNFFLNYRHIQNHFKEDHHIQDETSLKRDFYEDLCLLLRLRSLLEEGYITLLTLPNDFCPKCLSYKSFDSYNVDALNRERKRLENEYLANTSLTFERHGSKFYIRCNGPEPYFEHGGISFPYTTIPQSLTSKPKIMNRIRKGGTIQLSHQISQEFTFHKRFAGEVVRNISYDLASAQILNTSFLTNKSLHISFLESLSNDPDIERRNAIALEHLTSLVPFVGDVEIQNLLKIRRREEESFIKYRHALNEAIDEFRANKNSFSEKDARALYSDVIAPHLSSLDQGIKDAKRDLLAKPLASVGALVGVISFGIYTGILPNELVAMAKALGLSKIAYDVLEKTILLKNEERAIRNEDLYFLWKVRKKASAN